MTESRTRICYKSNNRSRADCPDVLLLHVHKPDASMSISLSLSPDLTHSVLPISAFTTYINKLTFYWPTAIELGEKLLASS